MMLNEWMTRIKWYTQDFLAESQKLLEKAPTSKEEGLTPPTKGMSNISKYSWLLPDFACCNGNQSSQPGPRRSRRGLCKQDSSYNPRGKLLDRRGQANVSANLPDHPAQSIALDMLYPMHFTHLC
ncbi:uncharacterized protein TNCV_1293801 [Trichonephila clavipes]|nr:uncharacterized protein TNCV_1293801 [Trichonephila clavipes]